jgi:hypothetical protein
MAITTLVTPQNITGEPLPNATMNVNVSWYCAVDNSGSAPGFSIATQLPLDARRRDIEQAILEGVAANILATRSIVVPTDDMRLMIRID